MIFESGLFFTDERCPSCGIMHRNVSIPEEVILCVCGTAFVQISGAPDGTEQLQIVYGWRDRATVRRVGTALKAHDKRDMN
jgi:hypothetical protein